MSVVRKRLLRAWYVRIVDFCVFLCFCFDVCGFFFFGTPTHILRPFYLTGPSCKYKHVRRLMCQNYLTGFCSLGPDCPNGHPKYELPQSLYQNENDGILQKVESRMPMARPGIGGGSKKLEDVICYRVSVLSSFVALWACRNLGYSFVGSDSNFEALFVYLRNYPVRSEGPLRETMF